MKPFSAASIVLSLLLLVCSSHARFGPGDYWNAVMNGEAMPQVIKDLLHQNAKSDQSQSQEPKYLKDFDTKPNVIIYHKGVVPDQEVGSSVLRSSVQPKFLRDFDTKPNVIIYHKGVVPDQEVGSSVLRSSIQPKFLRDFDTKPNVIIYHKGVVPDDQEVGSSVLRSSVQSKFLRDFDTKPNVIIYHKGKIQEMTSLKDKEEKLAVEQANSQA